MKCPNPECGRKIQVSDSREKNNGNIVKRRRRCNHCNQAWTTCEVIQNDPSIPLVYATSALKRNLGSHEIYNEVLNLVNLLKKTIEPLKNSL